jgi:phospholipid/cholesterol/gamma-HCH transport system substrate-binding protein
VKSELTKLSAQLGPSTDSLKGPLSAFIDQAAETFDGKGESFREALRELSQTAGRLGDSRTDVFGTIKNLQVVIEALSASNDQIVQFAGHLASVSQVLADSSNRLDATLNTLNVALQDARKFLHDNNATLIGQIDKLADFTKTLSDRSEDIEQVLHVGPNGLANFYAMYNPAQASLAGTLAFPDFANPVQFICGSFDAGDSPDNFKRAEICRQRMAPVLKRLTMNYPPILFHPINSITAYDGQIIYDTPATEAKARTPVAETQWQPQTANTADVTSLLVPPEPVTHGSGG